MNNPRLKVLIIAHECLPTQGSECAVGWNISIRLAKYHDVTVLYASGSQRKPYSYTESLSKYLTDNGPFNGITFINIDQPRSTKFIASINKRFAGLGSIGLPLLYYLGYRYWQKSAFKRATQIHASQHFDIVHQVTQVAVREPGLWWKLGIPFFWGPTGGLTSYPPKFYKILSAKARILEVIRKFSNFYKFHFSSRVISANKKAAVIYTYSNEDSVLLKKRANGKIKLMLDVGTSNYALDVFEKESSSLINGIWCGEFIERKAPFILLQALSLSNLTKEKIKLQIIGSGPLENKMHAECKKLRLENIEWLKNIDHKKVFELMSKSDFLIHTSIREATSSVIPEALSTGLPVICHDISGMSIAIDDSCGIKIPMTSPDKSVRGFHAALEQIILNENLLTELKKGAKRRSLQISWDNMAETIANDYTERVKKNL